MTPIMDNLQEITKEVSLENKELEKRIGKNEKDIWELFRRSRLIDKGLDDSVKLLRKETRSLKMDIEGLAQSVEWLENHEADRLNKKIKKKQKTDTIIDVIVIVLAFIITGLAGIGVMTMMGTI